MGSTTRRLRGHSGRRLEPYMLLFPAMIVSALFILWPIIKTFSYSVMSYSPLKPNKTQFIGLGNFKTLLQDKSFWRSLRFSALYSVVVVAFEFILGLALALLMRDMKIMSGVYRAAVFAPWAVSGVLTAIIWKLMFNGSYGAINDLLVRLGILEKGVAWGTTRQSAIVMVIVASVWRGIPYFAINMLAALLSIPNEMYESAKVDGAGSVRTFFSITLPYLRETIVMTTLLRIIWTFNNVDIVYSLTGGGPNNATLTLPVYITRNATEYLDFGYGSALTIGLFVILLVFAIIYMQFGKSNGDISG